MFCIKCGAKLPEDARFCYVCGKTVGDINPTNQVSINNDLKTSDEGNGKYKSYFTKNSKEKSHQNMSSEYFREYGEDIFFMLPEYNVTAEGKEKSYSNDLVDVYIGKINKKSGKKTLLKKLTDYCYTYECINFSIFDDNLYTWKYDDYDEETVITEFNLKEKKIRNIKRKNKISYVLKNKNGSLIYFYNDYIEEENSGRRIVREFTDGCAWLERLTGYNERYVYYEAFNDGEANHYCMDLTDFNEINLTEKITDILEEDKIHLIDAKTDIIYIEKNNGILVAYDWQNKEVWSIEKPDVSDLKGNKKIYFNGEYWTCFLNPDGDIHVDDEIGIICYDQNGKEIGRYMRKFDGYYPSFGYHTIFSYKDIICTTLEIVDSELRLIINDSRGHFEWLYYLFYIEDGYLRRGEKPVFLENYANL